MVPWQTVMHRPSDIRADVDVGSASTATPCLHAPERRPDGAARRRAPRSPRRTGIDVVYDLRAADWPPAGRARRWRPSITARWLPGCRSGRSPFVNIGGVANVTWIGARRRAAGVRHRTRQRHDRRLDAAPHGLARDEDGRWPARAACTRTTSRIPAAFLFRRCRRPSRSTAMPFALDWSTTLTPEDGAATLTAFTAASIARAREHFPEQPRCG